MCSVLIIMTLAAPTTQTEAFVITESILILIWEWGILLSSPKLRRVIIKHFDMWSKDSLTNHIFQNSQSATYQLILLQGRRSKQLDLYANWSWDRYADADNLYKQGMRINGYFTNTIPLCKVFLYYEEHHREPSYIEFPTKLRRRYALWQRFSLAKTSDSDYWNIDNY